MKQPVIKWDSPAEIVKLRGNPMPRGEVGCIEHDGFMLRMGVFVPRGKARATLVLMTGFGEFIEKYFETIAWFIERGYVVVVPEWRGHGLSEKTSRFDDCLFIDDFDKNITDLGARFERVVLPHCPRPVVGLAHSMGGQISLRAAAAHPDWFVALAQSAPMYAIRLPGVLKAVVGSIAWMLRGATNILRRPISDTPISLGDSEVVRNIVTHDAARFARTHALYKKSPRLWVKRLTFGWFDAAARAMAATASPDYLRSISQRLFIGVAGDEKLVENDAIAHIIEHVKGAETKLYKGAMHEILMEKDATRLAFLDDVDAFFTRAIAQDAAK